MCIRDSGHAVLDPASGRLTGKDSGPGRLPEPQEIFDAALALVAPASSSDSVSDDDAALRGRRVLVTAGGTREALDPVRFLGNRSSGKQGVALAHAARDAGAHVHLIVAHVETELPSGVDITRVSSARELQDATLAAAREADVVIMAAAVADYRPDTVGEHKMKKSEDGTDPVIRLVRNPDILRAVVAQRAERSLEQLIVGFAAETGDAEHSVLDFARAKLERKGCDLLVLNEVGTDKVFGRDDTEVTVLSARSSEDRGARGTKDEVARFVVQRIAEDIRTDG